MPGHRWATLVGIAGCSNWSRFLKALDGQGPVTQKNREPSKLKAAFPIPIFSLLLFVCHIRAVMVS